MIDASRHFVCARLATYEDEEEGKFLESIFVGRAGNLENTVFCILSPDGKKKLVRSGRSPSWVFSGPEEKAAVEMAVTMNRIAGDYSKKKSVVKELPYVKDVRLALNVAACDGLPLVVVRGKESEESPSRSKRASQASLEKMIRPLIWEEDLLGRFVIAPAKDEAELEVFGTLDSQAEILIIAPDTFGQNGTVLVQVRDATEKKIGTALRESLSGYRSETKDQRRHVSKGGSRGVHWETEIPVTDTRAREVQGGSRTPRRNRDP